MRHTDGKSHLLRGPILMLLAGLALVGCSPSDSSRARVINGEQSRAGAQLAYEHELSLALPGALLAPRMQATREACETARFGACNILGITEDGSGGQIILRIAPTGVEPMVAMAAEGGTLGQRITTAEDLADAVADVRRRQDRLQSQQLRLDELAKRKDITVSDLIALSKEQAGIENELQELAQVAAGQQRRLDTNRVTLNFRSSDGANQQSRFSRMFNNLGDNLVEGTADALERSSYVLPFVILAFPVVWLWVWLWRRFVVRSRPVVSGQARSPQEPRSNKN
ncbi:DUF4349 domain-containing protein [Pseudomonas simiae]|uniref:DUF4349 domain-containing protein n=1 Tax=Pseudomonas simiae TaxID=321846 RepID=UPI0005C411B5|nr:DUF4349 domain-containing protein [Pseudomonas simiae]MBD8739862.1 DUF4349 domain-containing protein [Pseudomonas fluorescens]AJP51675.1 lipoprotein [Pseudomonas simiae]QQD29507.1 DUF4349 domain-containing protein [Pseudomonas simiae]TKK02667.1 DUF4349 domain-containing protein [Pseudomonas fluorescens]WLG75973.1 DUF4349 domain-containing protein [Pseudomonas simiae]